MRTAAFLIVLFVILCGEAFPQGAWQWITPYPSPYLPSHSDLNGGRFITNRADRFISLLTADLLLAIRFLSLLLAMGSLLLREVRYLLRILLSALLLMIMFIGLLTAEKTWTNYIQTYGYYMVEFAEGGTGWLLGSAFSKSTDYGVTWNYLNSNLFGIPGPAYNIFALDEHRLWVCKSFNYDNGGSVCYSSDGGYTWSVQSPVSSDSLNHVFFVDVRVNETGIGFAVGYVQNAVDYSSKPLVLRTTDFGSDWQVVPSDSSVFPRFIVSKNDREWVLVGTNEYNSITSLMRTDDSGLTWEYKTNIFGATVWEMVSTAEYVSSEDLLLVSGTHGIYRSYDFGDSFTRVSGKNDISFNGFAIDRQAASLENQLAVVISNGDSLIFSEDGGRNWEKQFFPDQGTFTGEVAVSERTIFAVTNATNLIKSTDHGASWQVIFSGFGGIRNLEALSSSDVAFVSWDGRNIVLFYTLNGGENWYTTPYFNWFENDMDMFSPGKVYACGRYAVSAGSQGYIYSTDNYGRDWRIFDTEDEVLKIKSLDPSTAFAVSAHNQYRTTNAGKTWVKRLHTSRLLFKLFFQGFIEWNFEYRLRFT